jgi:hypothetical protein
MNPLCGLSVPLCASAVIRSGAAGSYFADCVLIMSRKPWRVMSFRSDVE